MTHTYGAGARFSRRVMASVMATNGLVEARIDEFQYEIVAFV